MTTNNSMLVKDYKSFGNKPGKQHIFKKFGIHVESSKGTPVKLPPIRIRNHEGDIALIVTDEQKANLMALFTEGKTKRKHDTIEQGIQKEIIDMWERFGAVVVKVNNAGIRKPDGTYIRPRTLGVSDLIIGYRGLFVAMEVKAPGGKVSPAQHLFLQTVEQAKCIKAVVYSLDDAIKVKEAIDKTIKML